MTKLLVMLHTCTVALMIVWVAAKTAMMLRSAPTSTILNTAQANGGSGLPQSCDFTAHMCTGIILPKL